MKTRSVDVGPKRSKTTILHRRNEKKGAVRFGVCTVGNLSFLGWEWGRGGGLVCFEVVKSVGVYGVWKVGWGGGGGGDC